MRLLFMGTPVFALPALERLVAQGHEVTVVTQPDRPAGRGHRLQPPPVKERALQLGLRVLQPETLRDPAVQSELAALAPEAGAVVAYGRLIPPALLSLPPLGFLNVHPSLLPRYRGAAPIQRALMDGCTETGVTILYLTQELDAGDIILQERVPVGPDEDAGSLHDRLAQLGAELLAEALHLAARGEAPRIPQDPALATYAEKIGPNDQAIAWERPARVIHNQVRALSPQPGAFCQAPTGLLKVWRTAVGDDGAVADADPGTILAVDARQGLLVATGQGTLWLREVQPAGRRRLAASDYVNGARLRPGDRLRSGEVAAGGD